MTFNVRQDVIHMFDYYTTISTEARYKAIKGEEIKIMIPKQMLQRLPIALAQVNGGNTSENLPN